MPRRHRELPTTATAHVPGWMWEGNPRGFFALAELHARLVSGTTDQWSLQTSEAYRQASPSLVSVAHLAGPGTTTPRLDLLLAAASDDFLTDAGGLVRAERELLRRRAVESESLVDRFSVWLYDTADETPDQLEGLVGAIHASLTATPLENRPGERPLQHAGVHLVRRAPALVHRGKFTSMLLQAEHDPRARAGDTEHLRAAIRSDELAFNASTGLYDGILVGDAYLGPLLGALPPFIWAFAAHRALGAIIYSLGRPLSGTPGRPTELLHLLPSQGSRDTTALPVIPPGAPAAALDWWTARLNAMFGVLTDPAIFTDRAGTYLPGKHLQALLTVEQLFRRVSSIQTVHRDANARRVLLFSVLDTLERLTGRAIHVLCSLRIARQRLEAVTDSVPSGAATILLPAATRAVDALRDTQDGLFLRRHLGSDDIEVPAPGEGTQMLDPDTAVAEYIKVLRNATHGHGSTKGGRGPLTTALLAHHSGNIPHDLALLGYLYLLDVLVHPQELAQHLHGGGRS